MSEVQVQQSQRKKRENFHNGTPDASTFEKVSRLLSSAPSSPKPQQTVTADIRETVEKCTRRSKTCIEGNKHKCTITSDRLAQLRKTVENAIKEHKIFSIKGAWPVIRRELMKRNWIEKLEQGNKQRVNSSDDVTSNLPAKQDWESPATYVEKCERTVMSRMLSAFDVDFYWSMRKDPVDLQHRGNCYKLINRFSRSLFASKEGLALLLQQSYWYSEENISNVNFPRCYVLGFPDHYNMFVDDFRQTACMGLLKWFTSQYEEKLEVSSIEGTIPHTALQFSLDRCTEYIAAQKHVDIDKDFPRVWDHEWEQFLGYYYGILHRKELFFDLKDKLLAKYAEAKACLKDIYKYWPQYDIDGMRNIWIIKPGNKCRGRGIQLVKSIADVDKIMGLKMKYVVQKYIEKPLVIYQTKFDIRQWFMVTNVQPLTIWMYRDSYLRFSSQLFSLENFHESLHLTNHAVQCKYTNGQQRDKALPDDNMWDCHTFKAYLKQIGCMDKWNKVIYPGMKQNIICAMLASQDTMDRRPNTYEIYGADFVLGEDFTPWLLEINCSPDMSFSTSVTSRLCPQCMEDVIKVVIDKKRDSSSDTGLFDMIYKQNCPKTPPYLGMNLSVRGRKLFRNKLKSSKPEGKDQSSRNANLNMAQVHKPSNLYRTDVLSDTTVSKILPKILSSDMYKGPVIEDLMEEIHKSIHENDSGIRFAQPVVPTNDKTPNSDGPKKKSSATAGRADRVPKNHQIKHKVNTKSSLYRKLSANEKIKTRCSSHTAVSTLNRNQRYFGLFEELAAKPAENATRDVWEKGTTSILSSEKVFNKTSSKFNSLDVNKNLVKTMPCLNLHTFDLNKLLPEINGNCTNGA